MSNSSTNRDSFERPTMLISNSQKESIIRTLQYLLTVGLILFVAFPILWLFLSTLKESTDLFARPPVLIPTSITVDHYASLVAETRYPTWFKNSLIIASGVVFLTTTLSAIGGYGLARAKFWGKTTLARSVLLTYMYPAILLAIPLYLIFARIGLVDSHIAVILGITGRALPFGIWIMWQQFQSIPPSYEESAWIDGASMTRTLFQVLLPIAFPAIAAVMVFSFAVAWGEYTIAKVIIINHEIFPVTLGIEAFTSATRIQWRYVLTSSIITVLPPLLMVVVLQKHFLRGFSLQ